MGDLAGIDRIRRNHAIEHAVVAFLIARGYGPPMVGYSTPGGFWIYGMITTEDISNAVDLALIELKAGKSELAISPFCGTNFAVGILGAILFTNLINRVVGNKWTRISLIAAGAISILPIIRPLGMIVQRQVTTLPNVGEPEILVISRLAFGKHILHRITVGAG